MTNINSTICFEHQIIYNSVPYKLACGLAVICRLAYDGIYDGKEMYGTFDSITKKYVLAIEMNDY
jgi:1-aminocyclopropane-1-carboxylate deaminase/D-cysteine desulfhydrase-like pyridoxal-dependent ACC family enzyme